MYEGVCKCKEAIDFKAILLRSISRYENETIHKILDEYPEMIHITGNSGKTLLHYASYYLNLKLVNKLIDLGISVNSKDDYGKTPLFYAMLPIVTKGVLDNKIKSLSKTQTNEMQLEIMDVLCLDKKKIIERILKQPSFNVNAKDSKGNSYLHYCSAIGDVNLTQKIIDQNAHIDIQNNNGETPLVVGILEAYMNQNNPNYEKKDKNLYIVKLFLENQADIRIVDNNGRTPIHYAAALANTEYILSVLRNGGNLNAVDKTGKSPIHYACENGCAEVLEILIEKNADVNIEDTSGMTPLYNIMLNDNSQIESSIKLKMLELVLGKGANVCCEHNDFKTVLHCALRRDYATADLVIRHVEENKLYEIYNIQDRDGMTPLHIGIENVSKGNSENILKLVDKTDLSLADKKGKTPLEYLEASADRGIILDMIDINRKTREMDQGYDEGVLNYKAMRKYLNTFRNKISAWIV